MRERVRERERERERKREKGKMIKAAKVETAVPRFLRVYLPDEIRSRNISEVGVGRRDEQVVV